MSRIRYDLPRYFGEAIKLFVVLAFLFPFYWMVITSFKTYAEAVSFPPTFWPRQPTLDSYKLVLESGVMNYVKNTVIVTGSIIVLQIAVMVPAAYAFAKIRFYGKTVLFSIVLAAQMIPVQLTFITIYLLMARWGLIPTLIPQIIPFGANVFGIFLMRQNFMQVPDEIIEAAKLDNAGDIKIMFMVMLPMARSTMITLALFSFIAHWNAYFWPLVMTDNNKVRPIAIAIDQLRNLENASSWATIMAGNAFMMLPLMVLFVFASQRIIKAFAYRGVK
jgi:sn-glycerol 3-phosphate transport system permease protein